MRNRGIALGVAVILSVCAADAAEPMTPEALVAELLTRNQTLNPFLQGGLPGLPAGIPSSPALPGGLDVLFGNLLPAQPGGSLATIQTFLTRFAPLIGAPGGLDAAKDLMVLASSRNKDAGDTMVLMPALDGVPFPRGAMTFALGKAGELAGVIGRWRPPAGAQMGSIDGSRAIEIAIEELGRELPGTPLTGDGAVDEYIDDVGGTLQRVLHVALTAGEPPQQYDVLVSGAGQVLNFVRGSAHATTDGYIYLLYPQRAGAYAPLGDLFFDPGVGAYRLRSAGIENRTSRQPHALSPTGRFAFFPYLTGYPAQGTTDPGTDPNTGFDNNQPNPNFLETNLYFHLARARDQALAWGAHELNQPGNQLKYDAWLTPPCCDIVCTCNLDEAHFDPRDITIRFFNQQLMWSTHGGMDTSVIYHEFGHYVSWAINKNLTGPLPTSKSADDPSWIAWLEARAVWEGFADYFAASITFRPEIMEVVGRANPIMKRTTIKDPSYTYDAVTPCFFKSQGGEIRPTGAKKEIHDAGQVFASACWEMGKSIGEWNAMRIVLDAIRTTSPCTFRNVSAAIAWGTFRYDQSYYFQRVAPIFRRRGLLPPGW